jgi:hypothetical protein
MISGESGGGRVKKTFQLRATRTEHLEWRTMVLALEPSR